MAVVPVAGAYLAMQKKSRPAAVGLTGGIGSGKSTVAEMFAELGVPVLDLDRVGHEVVRPGSEGLAMLVHEFGKEILLADGRLDRKKLARKCFSSKVATERLNGILHPLIWAQEEEWLADQDAPYAVIEASVLIESGGAGRMDAVIVVLAEMSLRRKRAIELRGLSSERFEAVVARQCGDDERRRVADYLIKNDAGLNTLRQQVARLHETLCGRFAPRGVNPK